MSGVIKEFECKAHGVFECTVPICPAFDCDSRHVKQVFLTPPTIGSDFRRRFDKGIKRSAEMYGIPDFRSARAGESSFEGRAPGNGMLWGDDVKKVLGVDVAQLASAAGMPMNVTHSDGTKETLDRSVMRELAQAGMTQRVLPKPAELIRERTHADPK